VLAGILVVGTAMRLYGLMWGSPVHLHCDENTTLGIAISMGHRFGQTGGLQPPASCYGALPLYLLLIGMGLFSSMARLTGLTVNPEVVPLMVGRGISMVADSGAIVVIYLVGRRAFGKRAGLIGAAFYATALLPIREAHFFTVDPLSNLMLLLFLLTCLKCAQDITLRNFVVCGVTMGLALSTKAAGLILLLIPIIIWSLNLPDEPDEGRFTAHPGTIFTVRFVAAAIIVLGVMLLLAWGQMRPKAESFAQHQLLGPNGSYQRGAEHTPVFWKRQIDATLQAIDTALIEFAAVAGGLSLTIITVSFVSGARQWLARVWRTKTKPVVYLATVIATFVIINPYSIIAPLRYWAPTGPHSISWNFLYTTGAYRELPMAWTFQFVGTVPYIYQFRHIYPYALGWPLLVISLLSVAYWLWKLIKGQAGTGWVVIVALVLLLAAMAGVWVKMTRYVLPQIPLFCLLAAGMVANLIESHQLHSRWLGYGLVTIALVSSTGWSIAYLNIYAHPDNRLAAFDFVSTTVPADSNVLIEEDDAWGIAGLNIWRSSRRINARMYDPYYIEHDYYGQPIPAEQLSAKRQYLQEHLQWADYLVLTDLRRERIRHLETHFPVVRRFYEHLFGGQLGWRLIAEFDTGPALFSIPIDDSNSEPTFRLFDHPHVYVLSKSSSSTPRVEQ